MYLYAVAAGQKKPEVRFVDPIKYSAFTKDLKAAMISQEEILKQKSKYSHFELDFSFQKLVKAPMPQKE